MDVSLLVLVAMIIGYVGTTIYLANQADLERKPRNASSLVGSREIAEQQRATIIRWMLYGIIAVNLVFSLLVLQLSLINNSPEMVNELREMEVEFPQVDQGGAVVCFVLALIVTVAAVRVITSVETRARIDRLIGESGLYDPESSVHTVAIVLALLSVSFTISQLVFSGGIAGLAEGVELSGISLAAELFTAALMIAIAFLGIGLAIRRTLAQSLSRLSLRLPTTQDVIWGVGVGIGLYLLLIVMGLIWASSVSPEQMAEQSAAAEQIAQAFNTLPLAFALSLAAGVSEEILFRGALQPIFGLIPTSLFFALVHIQYSLTPATIIIFVVGMGLGWLRNRQSTTAAIIAHFVYNFVQLALAILAAGVLNSNS